MLKHDLMSFFSVEKEIDYGESLRQTVAAALDLPPVRFRRPHLSFGALLLKQTRYLALKIWTLQGAVLAALCALLLLCFGTDGAVVYSLRTLRIFFSLCGTAILFSSAPLWMRSRRYRMQELEASAYFARRGTLLAPLLFIGLGDAVMLAVFGVFAARTTAADDGLLLYLVIPFLTAAAVFVMLLGRLGHDGFSAARPPACAMPYRTAPSYAVPAGAVPACIGTACAASVCIVYGLLTESLRAAPSLCPCLWSCYALLCAWLIGRGCRTLYRQEPLFS